MHGAKHSLCIVSPLSHLTVRGSYQSLNYHNTQQLKPKTLKINEKWLRQISPRLGLWVFFSRPPNKYAYIFVSIRPWGNGQYDRTSSIIFLAAENCNCRDQFPAAHLFSAAWAHDRVVSASDFFFFCLRCIFEIS